VTGVTRALAVNGLDPGTNEIQQVAITGGPTGGTFTLTYSGQTTGAIAYNATRGGADGSRGAVEHR
jgi:hypothetical protein